MNNAAKKFDENVPNPGPLFARGKIYSSILETVGGTPLVAVDRIAKLHNCHAELILKLEFFNPLSSVKDRIGVAMIEWAEQNGVINADSVIIEATSGNTGIGLAFTCAVKQYRLILVMPETVSVERKMMLKHLGAEIILTPKEVGVIGAIEYAQKLAKETEGGWMVNQDYHPANLAVHKEQTAQEILTDTEGHIDYYVGGVGTSGTLTGVASVLKKFNSKIKIVAVEPKLSPVLSKGDDARAPHRIPGIGAFVPNFYDPSLVDEIQSISCDDAMEMARACARTEGIPIGISGGAALCAAISVAKRPESFKKRIVVLIPSSAERYISTDLFSKEQLNHDH